MARLSILSLGTLHITLDAVPLTAFASDKARALLTYLAVESDRPHRRERLAGLLWPEYPERHARHTLSQALLSVRQVTGDHRADESARFFDVRPDTLQFCRHSDYWLDLEPFTTAHHKSTLPGMANSLATLEQALALYRGPFMDGFSLPDSPAFEEWLLLLRERLERTAMQLLEVLVRAHTAQGAYEPALRFAWRQLELDPWREDVHRAIMQLLVMSGQRSAALAQYDLCRRTLERELGVAPEAETEMLSEAIRRGKIAPPHASTTLTLAAHPPSPSHNLPVQLMPCIGRETEIAAVQAQLQTPGCRMLALVGPGGIGKTRLALEAVAPLVSAYTHGVFFVSLTPLQSAQAIAPTIAQAIGFIFSDKDGTQEAQLLAYLKNKTMLLILDNVEHLLRPQAAEQALDSAAITIANLLEAAPGVKIVLTSRVGLNILGEVRFAVPPLAYPENTGKQPEPVHEDLRQHLPAVQLFVQSARRQRPDFALTADNVHAVSTICRAVQGLPLALLLTASWVATLSTTEIAALLTDEGPDSPPSGLDLLETDWPNVPPRHRSLRAVFEHSWRLLTEREQKVYKAFAVFRGGFTQAAAFDVAGATPQDLRALVNASFLHRETSGRYAMQELLRQYAAESLADDPEAARQARDRHCAYYIAAMQRWAEDAKGPHQQDVLLEMDGEIDNARAAWEWAVAQGDLGCMDQAVQGLCLFYQRRIRRVEGEAACRAAVERLDALAGATPAQEAERLRVLSRVLTWHSCFLSRKLAFAVAERSLTLLEQPALAAQDMRAEKAAALWQLGRLHMNQDREQARRCYERSLALYQTLDAAWEQSQLLDHLGFLCWAVGEFHQAQAYHEQSRALARSLRDVRGLARAIQGLSGVAMGLGHVKMGAALSQESLELRRRLGDPAEIADGLHALAIKRITLGRAVDALPLLEECRALTCDYLGLPGGYVHTIMAWARMLMGHYKLAQPLAETALRLMQADDDPYGTGWTYHVLGGIAIALTDYERGERLLHAGIAALQPINQREALSFALAYLALALCGQQRFEEARKALAEVLQIGLEISCLHSLVFGLVGMALIEAQQGVPERALERYALAAKVSPCIENCSWFWDVAGRHIEAATASLPAETIAAAAARGKAREIFSSAKEWRDSLIQTETLHSPRAAFGLQR